MRILLVFILFSLVLFGCNSSKIAETPAAVSTPIANTPIANTNSQNDQALIVHASNSRDGDLEYSGNDRISYNGFDIVNSEKGISINKKGKRLLFIKNQYEDIDGKTQPGRFGLRKLLGGNKKQLIYRTWTGGNHCCQYFSILDLSSSIPRKIFNSIDYEVQANLDVYKKEALGNFDNDKDGKLEFTQQETPYFFENCAYVSTPRIQVGFKYDEKIKKYLPMKGFVPDQKKWMDEYGKKLQEANNAIKNNQWPEMGNCEYDSLMLSIAFSYIFAGREKEGYNYLEKNYFALESEKDSVHFSQSLTRETIKNYKSDIRKTLSNNKLYKAIYNR